LSILNRHYNKPLHPEKNLMSPRELLDEKEKLVGRFGPWTAHNVHLGHGVYTLDHQEAGQRIILRRIAQVIQDIAHRPLPELRILDLACLEGLYGIELALQGARAVGIEGRQANIEKARFVKQVLNLANLELIQDDVRHISSAKYGRFDVVICAGILYHLGAPDVFCFLEQIFDMCTDLAIFETHVSIAAKEVCLYKDKQYFGSVYTEHSPDSGPEEREKSLWASLDNVRSFWFTKPSLLNVLSHTGFTSVYECHNPSTIRDWADRITLVAVKGTRKPLVCLPTLNSVADDDWPEKSLRQIYPSQRVTFPQAARAFGRSMLHPAKGLLRKLTGP
jgi:predicted RNA methylase